MTCLQHSTQTRSLFYVQSLIIGVLVFWSPHLEKCLSSSFLSIKRNQYQIMALRPLKVAQMHLPHPQKLVVQGLFSPCLSYQHGPAGSLTLISACPPCMRQATFWNHSSDLCLPLQKALIAPCHSVSYPRHIQELLSVSSPTTHSQPCQTLHTAGKFSYVS
jgi:hypothetical protein